MKKSFDKETKEKDKIKLTIKGKKKEKKETLEIVDLDTVRKKEKTKFKSFFTEPSFNLLEMLITLILVCSIVGVAIIWIEKKDAQEHKNDSLNGYESIKDGRLIEFIDLYTDIIENYYDNVDSDELLDIVTESMVEYLGDAYTGYMDKAESRNLQDKLEGKYEGLGIEVGTTKEEKIVVTKIFEGSPASKSDIKIGDVIKEVAGISLADKSASELSLLIKDSLTGKISVLIERDGKEETIVIDKGTVVINSVTTEIFDNVGYLKIDTFSNSAVNQVENALLDLESKGITSLVVDVRYNNGGYLRSAERIADLFIPKNKIIYQLKTNKKTTLYKALSATKRDYKVAVLINGMSASASEVFALAMKESYGATLVGTRSYGKGTVQQTSELSTGSLVKYTVASWLSPNGESINQKGITPDENADIGSEYIKNQTYENDGQLQAALKAIK